MGDQGDNYYMMNEYGLCPSWALSLGYMGVAAGAVLSNWGSAVSFRFGGFEPGSVLGLVWSGLVFSGLVWFG